MATSESWSESQDQHKAALTDIKKPNEVNSVSNLLVAFLAVFVLW